MNEVGKGLTQPSIMCTCMKSVSLQSLGVASGATQSVGELDCCSGLDSWRRWESWTLLSVLTMLVG